MKTHKRTLIMMLVLCVLMTAMPGLIFAETEPPAETAGTSAEEEAAPLPDRDPVSAEEAAALSMGVCQDYAHILLALLRHEHIPCRYVVGMMMGEGASHAWIEVSDGEKWIALDPTNNCPVDDRYINISHGRDAKDCTINQGFFYGLPEQLQEIHVVVEESSND